MILIMSYHVSFFYASSSSCLDYSLNFFIFTSYTLILFIFFSHPFLCPSFILILSFPSSLPTFLYSFTHPSLPYTFPFLPCVLPAHTSIPYTLSFLLALLPHCPSLSCLLPLGNLPFISLHFPPSQTTPPSVARPFPTPTHPSRSIPFVGLQRRAARGNPGSKQRDLENSVESHPRRRNQNNDCAAPTTLKNGVFLSRKGRMARRRRWKGRHKRE